jgi:lipoprotein-releasing system permease protein
MVRIKLVSISVIRVLAVFESNHTFIKLNLEYFVAKRLITAKDYKSSISAPIIKLRFRHCHRNDYDGVSVATGIGLQQKNQRKNFGFQWAYHYF